MYHFYNMLHLEKFMLQTEKQVSDIYNTFALD